MMVRWPRSSAVLITQWLEHPTGVRRWCFRFLPRSLGSFHLFLHSLPGNYRLHHTSTGAFTAIKRLGMAADYLCPNVPVTQLTCQFKRSMAKITVTGLFYNCG